MSGTQQPPTTKAPAPFHPGWNDPPPLSYSPQSQHNKPRTILNKRVAFPLSQPPPEGLFYAAPPLVGPPLVAGVAPMSSSQPLPVTTLPQLVQNNINEVADVDSESALREVLDILNGVIDSSSELGNTALDIKKRIAMMENSWRSGNLSQNVQRRMLQLAIDVREERPRRADEAHKALMVEHAGEVSAWMPGVRRLLHNCIARQDLLAIDMQHSD